MKSFLRLRDLLTFGYLCLSLVIFGYLANSVTQKNGISAWQNKIGEFCPPERIFFGRTGLSFGRKRLLAPPKKCPKNAYGHESEIMEKIASIPQKLGTIK